MRLLITRPLADARPLAEHLHKLGHQTVMEPLLEIKFLATAKTDLGPLLDGAQALLVTSANGVRAFAQASARRDLAVYAVGEASARAAREAGFAHVDSADGDVVALAGRVARKLAAKDGALVHVAGSRVAGDLAGLLQRAGFEYRRAILYDAQKATHLSAAVASEIAAGGFHGVLFYSPRTAASFLALIEQGGLVPACRKMIACCLSEAVAEKARAVDWRELRVAAQPDQQSLIATLGQ